MRSLTVKSLHTGIAFLAVATLNLSAAEPAGKAFLGAIPVQYVAPNEELVLDMHRFFQPAGNDKLELGKTNDAVASYDPATFQLRVRAGKPGIFDIAIKAGDNLKTVLTLASAPGAGSHRFAFKPAGSINKVFLAGSFNGWSMDKLPLTGPNAEGEYAVEVPLKPGRYPYKFVVDGKWTLDPNNSQTEDNGMGDKNSVVVLAEESKNTAPVIYADRLTPRALFVRAVAKDDQLAKVSAIFEGASETTTLPAKINGQEVEVPIPSDRSGFVRVIGASSAGIPSNVVRCPVGAKESFHWQDAVLYYAFTDRFADGDKSNDHPVDNPNVAWPANFHGGDLRGITQKIDEGYFDKIGANTIWVAPLNKNPAVAYQEYPEPHRWYTGYHGYWPVSPTELDPHIGTDSDLRKLVETAHARGMKVIADLVLHHVHQEHPWWKEHRDWFGSLDLPDGRKNLRLWDEQQFTTWFEPYLPSFDFSKEAPVRALIDNSVWWANTYKLDGYRLDAVKHILPSFWWKFRAALREKVDSRRDSPLYLVGETFKDRAGIMSFVGPNMLDGQFDFPLYDQIKDTFGESGGGMKTLEDSLSASENSYGKETLMSPLVGNHDKGRFMAYADRDLPPPAGVKEEEVGWKNPPTVHDPASYAKLELAQAFLMAIDGVPMVYYGDEIGMTGAGDPDNRRDMRFGDKVTADEKRVLENFQKLGALRHQHPALRYGNRRTLVADQDLYAFVRAHLDDRVVVVFNRSKNQAAVDLNVSPELSDGDYVEALSGMKAVVKDGKLDLAVAPQTAAFVTKQ
jgi:cyclomaltodextrinase